MVIDAHQNPGAWRGTYCPINRPWKLKFPKEETIEMPWEMLTEEQKRNLYESYRGEMWYEWGDKARIVCYEEFCQNHDEYVPKEP